MNDFIALTVYAILQIIFLPLAIIGFIIVAYKQLIVSKKQGVSQTAVEIINGRWTMHVFGLREDLGAAKLTPVLPNTSTFGLWLVLMPLYLVYKISGKNYIYPVLGALGDEGIGGMIIHRTVYFDNIIKKHLKEAEQFVILGSGLDTRCYGVLKDTKLQCFELVRSLNQQHKLK